MEDVLMYDLIEMTEKESTLIFGGRDEDVAHFVEFVSQCVGALSKLIYLGVKKGRQCIGRQILNGNQIIWK